MRCGASVLLAPVSLQQGASQQLAPRLYTAKLFPMRLTTAAGRAIEEVTREKTKYRHSNDLGPRLHSHLRNRGRSLEHIPRSKVANPRASRADVPCRTLRRHRSAERSLLQADPKRVLRSENTEIDRKSAEEGDR